MLSETCLADLKDDNGISYQVLSYLRRISSNVLLTAEGEVSLEISKLNKST